MSDTTGQFKRQLPRNSAYQVLSFGTQVVVGLLLVPYLIRNLGVAAYGLIPVAGMLTQYAGLVSQSISIAVNRFLTIELQNNDFDEANRVFNTAFFSYLGIGILQIPLFLMIIYHAGSIITIPEGLYKDSVILLSCSAAAFIINLVASVFGVPMYAYNRIDLSRKIDISRYLLRVAGIIGFFLVSGPALRYVGYVDLIISLILCMIQVMIAKHLASVLRLRLKSFDWKKNKQILAMSVWLMINTVGSLLFLRMDVWICNRFVGAEAAGEYAALLQWPTLIRSGGAIISAIVAPMIMIYYSRQEIQSLLRLSKVAIHLLSLTIAVPISIICVLSPSILHLWLGPAYIKLAPLMVILLCHLVINVGVMPLFSVQVAMNKVRLPAIAALLMGMLNFALAVVFARYLKWGVYGVALAGGVVLTVKNALFTPVYVAILLQRPWYEFLPSHASSLGLLTGLMAAGYALSRFTAAASYGHLALSTLLIGIIGLTAIWLILPSNDRRLIFAMVSARATGHQGRKSA